MAHFRGELSGARTSVSCLGGASSGLHMKAASWQGAVTVDLYVRGTIDMARIRLVKHHAAGIDLTLYDGPVAGLSATTTA